MIGHPVTPVEAEELQHSREEAARTAMHADRTTLVSFTTAVDTIDPLAVFQRTAGEERALWVQPAAGFSMVAIGAAARLAGRGPGRFAQVEAARLRLLSTAFVEQMGGCPVPAPVLLGGFAFDPAAERGPEWEGFPDALLVVPRLLFARQGESCWVTVNSLADPDGDALSRLRDLANETRGVYPEDGRPAHREGSMGAALSEGAADGPWKDAVAEVVDHIRRGAVDKLVLARRVQVRLRGPVDAAEALRRLAEGYPHCTTFAFARGDACFLGATPERLVRVDRPDSDGRAAPSRVRADCLAGSARRGATEEEDRSLGEALLTDPKERHEHAVVVQALRDDLQPLCSQLDIKEAPGLLRMPNVQHLYTPIQGALSAERGVLELVERLHPTPAAGGLPREAALQFIRQWEPFDRGWYAGPVGWVDGRGEGEFAVAIRSALIRGQEAFLYAGCGIVTGSDPEREYAESCLKLRPMLWALNGSAT